MATATRGPWTLVGYPEDEHWDGTTYDIMRITDGGGMLLFSISTEWMDHDEAVANLELMAAAPQMRDMLREVAEESPWWSMGSGDDVCFFCQMYKYNDNDTDHAPDCLWLRARRSGEAK